MRACGGQGDRREESGRSWTGRAAAVAALAALTPGCGAILGIEDLSEGDAIAEGWSAGFGVSGRQAATDIALAGGSVLVTGSFADAIDLGGGPLPNTGGDRRFIASLEREGGEHRWSKSFGDASAAAPPASRLAGDGDDVIVAGGFMGSLGFGDSLLNSTTLDVFAARLGPSGETLWIESFGGADDQLAYDVAASQDDLLLAGGFAGTLGFGTGAATSAGLTDAFVAQLGADDGAGEWNQQLGAAGEDQALRVAIGEGGVAVAGVTQDGFLSGATQVPPGLFVAKLDPSGAQLWIQGFADTSARVAGVAIDPEGGVIVAGDFSGTLELGAALESEGQEDVFVARLDPSGEPIWGQRFGGAGQERCWDLHVDAAGDVAVTGDFTGALDLGGDPLQSSGDAEVFVAILGADGAHRWSRAFGGAGAQSGRSVTVDALGAVYLAGQFERAIDFGHGAIEARSAEDLFLAKLVPSSP